MEEQKTESITREDVAKRLLAIGRDTLELERIAIRMQLRVDRIKEQYVAEMQALADIIKAGQENLEKLCNLGRESLLKRGAKSLKTLFGTISWRLLPHKITCQKGVKESEAGARLIAAGHDSLTRVIHEVDRDAVKAALDDGGLSLSQLRHAGLRYVEEGEKFFPKFDREAVEEAGD